MQESKTNINHHKTLFFYEKSQRKTAITLLFNVAFLLFLWQLAHTYLTIENYGENVLSLLYWINIATPVTMLILFFFAVYFWVNNQKFYILLTQNTLNVSDPLFGDYTFEVSVNDITEVKHTYSKHTSFSRIIIKTQRNKNYYLTQNYRYNRAKLYSALHKINSNIIMPKNAYLFPQK